MDRETDYPETTERISKYEAGVGVQPASPLREAEVHLNDRLERVEHLSTLLRDRVEPVTIPSIARDPEQKLSASPDRIASGLGDTLRTWGRRLDEVGDRLEDLLQRIDL